MRKVQDELKNEGRIDGMQEYEILLKMVLKMISKEMDKVEVFKMIKIWNDIWLKIIIEKREEKKKVKIGEKILIGKLVKKWNEVIEEM